MDEAAWLACTDLKAMWGLLGDRLGDRKARLFDCACCRRIWHLLLDERSRTAVEVAERFADGLGSEEELLWAADSAWAAHRAGAPGAPVLAAYPGRPLPFEVGRVATRAAARVADATRAGMPAWRAALLAERQAQCDLLRDIIGNPFRSVALNPAWLRWNEGAVEKLARAIYDERRFEDLPILGDSLEEAGCTEQAILDHCRGGEHVLGCWLVDCLLAKT